MVIPVYHTRMLALFYRQLATLLSSGMPVIETMEVMASQGGNAFFKHTASRIQRYLVQGYSLGDSFVQLPGLFPAWHVDIIQYSETAGRLSDGLSRLADYLQKDYETQLNLLVGLAYPAVLLHVAIFLLPLSKGCFGVGCYLLEVTKTLFPLYAVLFLLYALIRMWHNSRFKAGLDGFVLSLPVLGTLFRQFALMRFIRALHALSASGVNISSAWRMAGWASGNSVVEAALFKGLSSIESGEALSKAFIQSRVFSPTVISMITAAERSGSIVAILDTIATYAEKENETAIAVLSRIMPVFIYLAVAGYIGFRIFSFYTGYYGKMLSF